MQRGEIFRSVEAKRPGANVFDLSYDHKLSLKMGNLYPVHLAECLPGDKFNISSSCMIRMAPMLAPIMHKVKVDIHFFFVPNRLVWDNWATFISGDDPFGTPPAAPYFAGGIAAQGSLADYMGLPVGVTIDKFSCIPFSMYQFIWNEYYRDQNLQAEVAYKLSDGDNTSIAGQLATLQKRAWQHDYFTSALPWAQKGEPVEIPMEGNFPVVYNDDTGTVTDFLMDGTATPPGPTTAGVEGADVGGINGYLYADASAGSVGITINDLRRANALQVWLEANARGGTRYTESILVHFGVKSPDSRLQRPEFIGGISNPVVISEVLQTSSTDLETPQGNMAGHGISAGGGAGMSYFCQEHGYIFGIMSVMPVTAYQQGLPRHFSKFDKFLYGWPELANLGEQEILNKELYYATADPDNELPFGYTPRYAEYKFQDNRVSGAFRSSLDFWHMGRKFASRPALNASFVASDPTTRIFAVELQEVDNLYAHVFHNIRARRLLPRFGIPSIM